MPERVESIQVETWRFPIPRSWGEGVAHHHLTLTEIVDTAGNRGSGFTWTPQIGATAIHAMVRDECVPAVVGGSTEPGEVWRPLWRHLREAGGTGVTTLAMAAIDIALWDLKARAANSSLVDLLGRKHDSLEIYGSGVNFHYSLDELQAQTERWVEAGFAAIKIKVGRENLDEDIERIAAVRAITGPTVGLMVDANQRWDLEAALAGAAAMEQFSPVWLEEPLMADDLRSHAELRRSTSIPLAIGENLSTEFQFAEAIALEACDIVQPNVARVGGITPFMAISKLAADADLLVAPHLLPDISAQLAMCLPEVTMVEDVEDASWATMGVLGSPSGVALSKTATVDSSVPGHGLVLDPSKIPGAQLLA